MSGMAEGTERAAGVRIAAIRIGARYRRDMGDLDGLAASILEVGLLHPIVVTPANELIAGQRRLAACKHLGWTEVAATVVPLADILRGEFAENVHRKDLLPSEAVAIKRALEPAERVAAKERQGGPGRGRSGNLPEQSGARTRDTVAAFTGRSGRTLDKADELVAAAEAEPEKYGKLVADMDRTGRVDGPYKRLVVARKAEAIAKEPPALPGKGPYRVIAVDAPWPYELRQADPSHRATHPYPQMSIDQIKALDVGSIAATDCILWLWTTNHHQRQAFEVLDAWGFQHKTTLTWAKDRMGTGDWLRGRTEHCLMAVRGKPVVTLTNQTTVIFGPLREHSRKPDEFYELVEGLCPGSKAELFQRYQRDGWDGHGDEIRNVA